MQDRECTQIGRTRSTHRTLARIERLKKVDTLLFGGRPPCRHIRLGRHFRSDQISPLLFSGPILQDGKIHPCTCLDAADRHTYTAGMVRSEMEFGFRIPLRGGPPIPEQGFVIVQGHAIPVRSPSANCVSTLMAYVSTINLFRAWRLPSPARLHPLRKNRLTYHHVRRSDGSMQTGQRHQRKMHHSDTANSCAFSGHRRRYVHAYARRSGCAPTSLLAYSLIYSGKYKSAHPKLQGPSTVIRIKES